VFADGYAPAANADPRLVAAASISLLCLFGGTPRLLGGTPPLADEMGIPDKGPSPARPLLRTPFRTPWIWNDHGNITFPARAIIFPVLTWMSDLSDVSAKREGSRMTRLHSGVPSGRLTNSNMATWVLSSQDSSVSPQTLQFA
jgi:hypothetical protein